MLSLTQHLSIQFIVKFNTTPMSMNFSQASISKLRWATLSLT